MKKKFKMILSLSITFALLLTSFITLGANRNIVSAATTQGFLSEEILPVGSKMNNLEVKFNTEKEPYKPGKNLVNLALGVKENSFTINEDGFVRFRSEESSPGIYSNKIPLAVAGGTKITVSINILSIVADGYLVPDCCLVLRGWFSDGTNINIVYFPDEVGFFSTTYTIPASKGTLDTIALGAAADDFEVVFSSFQVELGEQVSAYVPYYYAPAVNGVRLFTDSSGGYLGYKTFGDVIAYGYFANNTDIIFWANDTIESKGIFYSGWQMLGFDFGELFDTDEVKILFYSDNYSLHYNDCVYVSKIKTNSGGNAFESTLKDIFGDNMTSGKFGAYAAIIFVGAIILKKLKIL